MCDKFLLDTEPPEAYLTPAKQDYINQVIYTNRLCEWLAITIKDIMKLINNFPNKRNHEREGVCTPGYRILLIFINFNFLALYKMYFQNSFVNRSIKLESFTSHLQHSRPYCIRYRNLAFGPKNNNKNNRSWFS